MPPPIPLASYGTENSSGSQSRAVSRVLKAGFNSSTISARGSTARGHAPDCRNEPSDLLVVGEILIASRIMFSHDSLLLFLLHDYDRDYGSRDRPATFHSTKCKPGRRSAGTVGQWQ